MELKVKDLRQGSLVNCLHHKNDRPNPEKFNLPVEIARVGSDSVVLNTGECVPLKFLSGIEINEYYLKLLGWNYYTGSGDEGDMTKDFGGRIDIDWVDGKMQVKSHYEGYDMYRPLNHIKYVHQLQNLEVLNLEE